MAKDYRQIEGMRKQITECLENAYNRGYKQGIEDEEKKRDAITDKAYYDGYNKGAFEAWDCAKWLAKTVLGEETSNTIFKGLTVEEVVKQREEHKNKYKFLDIVVGDEIIYVIGEDSTKATVLDIDTDGALWIIDENAVVSILDKSVPRSKTGKHFDEVTNVLQKMRESEGKPRCDHCKHYGDIPTCQVCRDYSHYEYIYVVSCTESEEESDT